MRSERSSVWIEGIERHLEDLRQNAYEGALGADRQALYVTAVELLTPVAVDVLRQVSKSLLQGKGEVSVRASRPDGGGGSIASWVLTWPELSMAKSRLTGEALPPVTISGIFPAGFTHPHL